MNTNEPTVTPVGNYALVSLDDAPVPAKGVLSAALTIRPDGYFAWTETDTAAAFTIGGVWSIDGTNLTLTDTSARATRYAAVADGQTILFASSAQWRWRFERH